MKLAPSPVAAITSLMALLSRCTSGGAPSFELFGAYFPAWMFCGVIGIIGALIARAIFVATSVAEALPHQLTLCTGIGLIVALGVWLLFFR